MFTFPISAKQAKQCQVNNHYRSYLGGIEVGDFQRQVNYNGKQLLLSSSSKITILGLATDFKQTTQALHNPQQGIITESFNQEITGFKARKLKVKINNQDFSSLLSNDNESINYQHSAPIRDADTIVLEVARLVKQGMSEFELTRQASDGIETYHYQVQGREVLNINDQRFEAIKVKQQGKEQVSFWFEPSHHYRMLKARYHHWLLDGTIELQTFTSNCH